MNVVVTVLAVHWRIKIEKIAVQAIINHRAQRVQKEVVFKFLKTLKTTFLKHA
jgi:hypothetical protein